MVPQARGGGQTETNADRGGKFRFSAENRGSCGFPIMIPHTDYYLRVTPKWLPGCRSRPRFSVRGEVASDVKKTENGGCMCKPSGELGHLLKSHVFKTARRLQHWQCQRSAKLPNIFITTRRRLWIQRSHDIHIQTDKNKINLVGGKLCAFLCCYLR